MKPPRLTWITVAILSLLCLGSLFRILAYGDLRLSVATPDTPSYVRSSRNPLLSWKVFAGERLLTTNLLYKLTVTDSECERVPRSMPGIGQESKRVVQRCFVGTVFFQNILAILSWCALAYTFSLWIINPFLKLAVIVTILTFGFTPEIAEWESILSPESLTISLFILTYAILLAIGHQIAYASDKLTSRRISLLIAPWMAFYLGWIFIRDAHLYTIPITGLLVILISFFPDQKKTKLIAGIVLIFFAVFAIGYRSARDSLRATYYPVTNSFNFYIAPYPSRLAYFYDRGMPELNSPDLQAWMDTHLAGIYGTFLMSHPGFVMSTLLEHKDYFSSDYLQPYFKTKGVPYYDSLFLVGEFIHPRTLTIFLISVILIAGFLLAALIRRDRQAIVLAWMAAWFLLATAVTLFITFFGDVAGTRRHIFPSVEMLRLFVWLASFLFIDHFVRRQPERITETQQVLDKQNGKSRSADLEKKF
ncbi:MAG: hypothetical protein A2Y54_00505 [Chloroflexi bacterium RBG_16_51_16]|nr:MAG: hypothetical protein A2Y54_00505 [Chloroflexi bacterium RBG_16_51_16]